MPHASLHLPPAALQGALVALVERDTRALALDDAQRLTHFPASPLVTISWSRDADLGLVTDAPHGAAWAAFGARVMVSGTQAHPSVSWAPTTGLGYVACFNADAAQALFGLDLAAIQDRFVAVDAVIGRAFAPLWEALLACDSAAAALTVLEADLATRW